MAEIALGDSTLVYTLYPETGIVAFTCLPTATSALRVEKRRFLRTPEILSLPEPSRSIPAQPPESLAQLHIRGTSGPAAFAQGRTLRNGDACALARFSAQEIIEEDDSTTIETTLGCDDFRIRHFVRALRGELGFRVWTIFRNCASRPLTLEMIASFSLSGITPFDPADAPMRLLAHRIRSAWSAEGRLETRLLEDLELERSWTGHSPRSERFGQVGSMPVRGFFPFAAIEDTAAGVCWGAQLELASSWQLEIYRRHDDVCLSGGLADRELGHWWKEIPAGGSFETPKAAVATVHGDLEELCERLTAMQGRAVDRQAEIEQSLPIVFNEWCSSWGNPTHANVIETAKKLASTRVRYIVIDDGWAERPGDAFQQNGDWIINRKAFPDGLKATCDAIRGQGLIPGIWFEFEVCNDGSKAWLKTEHHLHRDGEVLRVGSRRFWDFRDPFVRAYLSEKVIDLLRDNGFGYLKVDYNETIGVGVDGAESPGEGLRQHIVAVQEFFREIRREIPDLVIENCSSGGHRLEPSMMAICAMGSFSDAHETAEIPIIALNLHRVILPRQSQIWAVLRETDSLQRLRYSLAATFLGRMAISGDLTRLSDEQTAVLIRAQDFYERVSDIIKCGVSRRFGEIGPSYRYPRGWQALRRASADGKSLLCVVHAFADPPDRASRIPLPPGTGKSRINSFPLPRWRSRELASCSRP